MSSSQPIPNNDPTEAATASIPEDFHQIRKVGPIGFKLEKETIDNEIAKSVYLKKGDSFRTAAEMAGMRTLLAVLIRIQSPTVKAALRQGVDDISLELRAQYGTQPGDESFLEILCEFLDAVTPAKSVGTQ